MRNLAVVYDGPGKVSVKDIGYPQLKDPQGRPAPHAVIVKVSSDNSRATRLSCVCLPVTARHSRSFSPSLLSLCAACSLLCHAVHRHQHLRF